VRPTRTFSILAVAGALALAACGSSSNTSTPGATNAPTSTVHVAIPVKSTPSVSAKMICEQEVRGEIASLLGIQTNQPIVPTWKDHVYSCTYHYPAGSITMSVKELADKAQTDAYFNQLAQQLGRTQNINGLGQGAFTTSNKSAVIRKDFKVMLVDISKLPAKFGAYHEPRGSVALDVAASVLSCWTGA
jgi:hypothetical protein